MKQKDRQSIISNHRVSLSCYLENMEEMKNSNEIYLSSPCFTPSDYSDSCSKCSNIFTSFKRKKYHCGYCGSLCCNKCLTSKCLDIWKLGLEQKKETVKVCDVCKAQRDEYKLSHRNERGVSIATPGSTTSTTMKIQTTFDYQCEHNKMSPRY